MKLLLILFFISSNVFAEDILIYFSKGKVVSIDSDGNEKSLTKGDYLSEGEILKTGENSFVILKIGSHSTHRVEESSEIIVEQLPYKYEDSEELQQGGRFFLKLGTIFSEIFQKTDNESFEVKTLNTTMGVRGTKLMASIDGESSDTWLTVNEGIVEVKNNISNDQDIVIKDQSMVIEKDKNFTRQQKYEWQKNLKWNIEQNKGNFKTFKKQRKLAYKEFRQRRSSWTRNEVRWKNFKDKRKEKLQKYKKRIKNLKGSKSLEKRKKLRKKMQQRRQSLKVKKVNEFRKKKSFYKKGMLNNNQKMESNSFIKEDKNRKRLLKKRDTRVKNLRLKRRKQKLQLRRRKKPVQK